MNAATILLGSVAVASAAIGMLILSRSTRRMTRGCNRASGTERQLLETFAYRATAALSRARLYANAKIHAAELEKKVAERTQELARAYEREREMISEIAHNLQTPLTVLQAKLEGMKPQQGHASDLRALEQSLACFSQFAYELLSLARLDGQQLPKLIPVHLSALIDELSEEVAIIGAAQGAEVHASVHPDVWVNGDEQRLREAFMNIASNALKYLKDIGGRVAIVLVATKDEARLTVIDTGIGIATDELPRIFDRFYRGSGPARLRAGTGLGLAIAKRIAEQHSGSIAAESAPGRGATFTITLPRMCAS